MWWVGVGMFASPSGVCIVCIDDEMNLAKSPNIRLFDQLELNLRGGVGGLGVPEGVV